MVREALDILTREGNSCVLQPTVAVLCGDVNLDPENADACIQPADGEPDVLTQWHTQTSGQGLSSDVAFVRGCVSEAFDVTIGASWHDFFRPKDCHDFFGVTVSVPLFLPDPKERQKKKMKLGDDVNTSVSQPGVKDGASASSTEPRPEPQNASVSQEDVHTSVSNPADIDTEGDTEDINEMACR